MQKIGSKITSLMGLMAVALIVYNAFIIVTALDGIEKISQGKKGLYLTKIKKIVYIYNT